MVLYSKERGVTPMDNDNNQQKPIHESFLMVYSIGITFLLTATLYLAGIVSLNSHFFLAVTLSGFFFVLADMLFFVINYLTPQKRVNRLLIKYSQPTRTISLFLSFFVLITVPYISLPNYFFDIQVLSEYFALLTIGLTILNISLTHMGSHQNNLKAQENKETDLLKKLEKICELSEKLVTDFSESTEMENKSLQFSEELSQLSRISKELVQKGISIKTDTDNPFNTK